MKRLPTLILLLMPILCAVVTGCKKEHTISYGPVPKPVDKDTALVTLKEVVTVTDNDRDGVYYKDFFYLNTRNGLKFLKAEHQLISEKKDNPVIIFEDRTDGPVITVIRRSKNMSYELHTLWSVPESITTYTFKYKFSPINN